jgi:MFS family permease
MMGPFSSASIIPAFSLIATNLGITIDRTSYLVSLQIAIVGCAPLLWAPFSDRFGRRPIFIISLIASIIANIGASFNTGFPSLAACCALVAFFISPAFGIGSGIVTETFFKHERARYIGVWTLLGTIGIPLGPVIFGFVAERVGYRWIFRSLAVVRFTKFPLPETSTN